MSLHNATEFIKKIFIGAAIGISVIIILVLIFRIGAIFKNIVAPPKVTPPNQTYDTLPALQFPPSELNNTFTYTLNTISGALPADFPDRINIYPLTQQSPNFLNLDKVKTKVQTLGFVNQQGNVLPEIPLGNGLYEWDEPTGINRKIKFNIVTFDFSLSSNYLASLTVLGGQNLNDENNAILTAKTLLDSVQLFPTDVDLTKTQNTQPSVNYNTYPQVFAIKNGVLVPATSLSTGQVIRVDFYQKDVEYDLDTGRGSKIKMKLPILYPHPPYSTMSFWIASGQFSSDIDAAAFTHRSISIPSGTAATYPIKSVQDAFDELKNGKAYIPTYSGLDKNILISNVYLAYYLGEENQQYLMPIIVFEGQKGFFAYVSAIKDGTK